MKNYITVLERKDQTSIASFQKALALTIKEIIKDKNLYLATLKGNEVIVSDWTGDESNLVSAVTSFYGTITNINVTTNKLYTAITPYIMSEKVNDFLIVTTPPTLSLDSQYSLTDFKSKVTEVHETLSLINLYEKSNNIATNNSKYVEMLNTLTSTIKSSPVPLKGIVSVTVYSKEVQISFTTDIERLVSTMVSTTDDRNISIDLTSPLAFVNKGGKAFNAYMFGLQSTSPENYGKTSSLTVREFLHLYDSGSVIALGMNAEATNVTNHIITLLRKLEKESADVRISSNPLE